jgi:hypothetical protein
MMHHPVNDLNHLTPAKSTVPCIGESNLRQNLHVVEERATPPVLMRNVTDVADRVQRLSYETLTNSTDGTVRFPSSSGPTSI